MQLDWGHRALLEITEDFVREGLTPSLWGQLMTEIFIYRAWHSKKRRCFYYEATSHRLPIVADSKDLPVFVPELIKVPYPDGSTRYTLLWRMKKDPNTRPTENEQSPKITKAPANYRATKDLTI